MKRSRMMTLHSFPEKEAQKDWPPKVLWGTCLVIMVLTFALDVHLPLGIASAVPYILAVLIAAFLRTTPVLFGVALASSFLTVFGMVYSPGPAQILSWHVLSNRGLAIFSIWIVAVIMDHRNSLEAKKEAAQARVRILEGLLAICANCKKIRDDSNVWHQLESYIVTHSEASFTHGLCPVCLEQSLREIPVMKKSLKIPPSNTF